MLLKSRFGRLSSHCLLCSVLLFMAAVAFRPLRAQELIANKKTIDAPISSAVQPQLRLERMLLLMETSQQQQGALDTLLAAQITPSDPLFHKWVTPAEFASRFSPSRTGTETVVEWLQGQGFSVAPLPASRQWIEFSGTAAQVAKAFGSPVVASDRASDDLVSASLRYRFAKAPKFPMQIARLVKGMVSLDGVQSTLAATPPTALSTPVESLVANASLAQAGVLTPALARTLLNFSQSATGAGETIAIAARSNVREEDFDAFRKSFNLPAVKLQVQLAGNDPGRTSEEAATIQAASWAGLTAPSAKILLVAAASTNATDGIDLALASAVDQSLARTVSIGYSSCEASVSSVHQAFYVTLYRQAAAEGISVIAASGDSGSSACHEANVDESVTTGFGVNALASTPWNTAVGAAAFSVSNAKTDGVLAENLTAWEPVSSSDKGYATGGGISRIYATPAWQSAQGVPENDPALGDEGHHRYLPDLVLPTAASSDRPSSDLESALSHGLPFCFSGQSADSRCHLMSSGGSAVSAAIFAGISAALAEKYGPQGNLAPNLYALNRNQSSSPNAFNDVTAGSARLPCALGTPDCSQGKIGFDAAVGYDLASGLGSVNAQSLITNWEIPQATGTAAVTVEMTTVGGITYNPSATINLTAKVLSGSGGIVPTGTVQFYDQTTSANAGAAVKLSAAGIATYSESGQFTNGGHNIVAKYSGDTTYEAGVSQPVTINIQPSATSMTVTPSTTTPAGGSIVTVTGVVTAKNAGAIAPTGLITVNLDGIAQGTGTLTTTGTTTSATVSVMVPDAGAHTIQGTYAGDSNYDNSTSPSVTVTVSKTASVTTVAATPSTITTGVPETFTASVAPAVAVTGTTPALTGTVSFYDGAVLLGTATVSSNTAVLTGITLAATSTHTVTAVYSGDATYTTSTSGPLVIASTLAPVTVTLTASTALLSPGQAVTLTALVTPVSIPPLTAEQHPSGFVLFYAGKVLVGTQAPVLVSSGDSGIASTFVSSLPAGQYVLTAVYSGDPTYGTATSNSLNLQVEDFTVSCSSTSITMIQGSTQSVPCAVASLGGLTGAIQVVCEEQNPPTVGAIICTFSPSIVDGTGTPTLSVATTAGNISPNVSRNHAQAALPSGGGRPPWRGAGGGLALAMAGLLLLSPVGRSASRLRQRSGKFVAMLFLLAGMAATGLGCSNTVTLTTNTGTPLGLHTLKITAAADVNTVTVSHYTYLTVNVTP